MLKHGIGKYAASSMQLRRLLILLPGADNVIRNTYYTGYTSVISGRMTAAFSNMRIGVMEQRR